MTDQSTSQDELKDAIIQGMRDAEISPLYTQGLGQVHEPVGQLARAMINEAEAVLDGVTFSVDLEDGQPVELATIRAAVATVVLALSVGANEAVKQAVVNPIADTRDRHDAVRVIAEAADQVAEEGATDDTLQVAMEQLEDLYRQGEEGKS